jgi:hypothetical protein
MVELKEFLKKNPLIKEITMSYSQDLVIAVYEWGYGTAYARFDIDDNKKKIRFSVDYGLYCEEAYIMQLSSFLTYLNAKTNEGRMSLYPDGRVICEDNLSYKRMALRKRDFEEVFSSCFFFERFIDEIRKLSVGAFVFTKEIIESKINEEHSDVLDDFEFDFDFEDDLDDLDEVSLPGMSEKQDTSLKLPDLPDFEEFVERMRTREGIPTPKTTSNKNENSELVNLINSASKKDDDKEDA